MNSLLAYETPGVEVFGFKINAYAMIIVFGIFVAFAVITLLFKRRNMSPDLFLTIFCICLPCCCVWGLCRVRRNMMRTLPSLIMRLHF